ncbi:hypothetical protein [Paenibacillus spongiae]|uniref:Uncharacterized protein n=1 Tax=Paenibacillus spongiae TaxID=2909671 RepID=A0ABY5S9F0_9BACL|nr:hypothetical protein [Paenibacillus spongiae]UVI29425.1 hypothetical protein L1F29_29065 [Paenibacillus spongiae]
MIKRLYGVLLLIVLATGCSSKPKPDAFPQYDSMDEAMSRYAHQERVQGSIMQLNLSHDRKLLLTELRDGVYFVGELLEREGKFSIVHLINGVDINQAAGAAGAFRTTDGKDYTIRYGKKEERGLQFVEELGVSLSVEEGDHVTDRNPQHANPNIIVSVQELWSKGSAVKLDKK